MDHTAQNTVIAIKFKEFLESSPPSNTPRLVTNATHWPANRLSISSPDLEMHCDTPRCDGVRTYRIHAAEIYPATDTWKYGFLVYLCGNCKERLKRFSLGILHNDTEVHAVKIGEIPAFGDPTPSRLISMLGGNRELFLKGRRAENMGLGIAAFAYYRRVVEAEKGRIIGSIAKVAAQLGASKPMQEAFQKASEETQFAKAIAEIKEGIPPAILINGHNPLTLLHSALSEGLHSDTDEDCLELAQHIRKILTEIAERISNAMKDDSELKAAVTRLLAKKSPQQPSVDPE